MRPGAAQRLERRVLARLEPIHLRDGRAVRGDAREEGGPVNLGRCGACVEVSGAARRGAGGTGDGGLMSGRRWIGIGSGVGRAETTDARVRIRVPNTARAPQPAPA